MTVRVDEHQYAAYQEWAQLKYQEQTGSEKLVSYPSLDELAEVANIQFRSDTPNYNEYRFLIAGILKSGIAAIHDKRLQEPVAFITIRDYVVTCSPLCDGGSWTFYLPDGTVFYEIDYYYNETFTYSETLRFRLIGDA